MTQNIDEFDAGTSKPTLSLVLLTDKSKSMKGEKIDQLNHAIQESAVMASETAEEKDIDLILRIIEYSNQARWAVGDQKNGVDRLDSFEPLVAGGLTNTAAAIDLAATICHPEILGERSLKPVFILITDGYSNDPGKTFESIESFKKTLPSRSGADNKMIRIALGVKGANEEELKAFASRGTIVHSDGTVEENVPFVFHCDEISALRGLLKNLTETSIYSQLIDDSRDDDTTRLFLEDEPDGPDWDEFSV
ncbi:MAG: VWA domain-containing protein [Solobacterium sp.]|nr:VWA domain-containing protein [Solobacterium sp.]